MCRKQKSEFGSESGRVFGNVVRLGVWLVVCFEVCLVVRFWCVW